MSEWMCACVCALCSAIVCQYSCRMNSYWPDYLRLSQINDPTEVCQCSSCLPRPDYHYSIRNHRDRKSSTESQQMALHNLFALRMRTRVRQVAVVCGGNWMTVHIRTLYIFYTIWQIRINVNRYVHKCRHYLYIYLFEPNMYTHVVHYNRSTLYSMYSGLHFPILAVCINAPIDAYIRIMYTCIWCIYCIY